MIKIALAGNPNCGKTTLFNALTGSNQFVGNWPGVTVEKKEGRLKGNKEAAIVDLPGIYSLSPYTLEEVVARNYLISEKPDAILNIIDGTNLERNLYLTTQLTELGIPVVIAVNMMDIVRKNGDVINVDALSKETGCKVIEISALKGENVMEAANAAVKCALSKEAAEPKHTFNSNVEAALGEIEDKIGSSVGPEQKRFFAVKLFERDSRIKDMLKNPPNVENIIKKIEEEMDDDSESIITNERYVYISSIIEKCFKKNSKEQLTISDKIDRIVTNRILALPIFAVVMFIVYYISVTTVGTIATDWANDGVFGDGWHLFGIGTAEYTELSDEYSVASTEADAFIEAAAAAGLDPESDTFAEEAQAAGIVGEAVFYDDEGNVEETVPVDYALYSEVSQVEEPDPADYGIWIPGIPVLIENALTAINCNAVLQDLILNGIVAGVGAVLGFVPQMLVLFIFLAFLEACGYMARIAFIMDRIFRKFGLSGKSFIPMLIGSGCGVPGVMASRTIESDRDRKMTIMTTTFVPCGAKLPIIALISGALFGGAWWVAPSAYFVGIAAIICSGIILKKTKLFAGDPAPFVMELPAYHMPTVGNVLRSMWERGWSFIKKAGTIILLSTIVIWFASSFGFTDGTFGYADMENSILAYIGNAVCIIFAPLGWGDWRAAVAAVTGLVAKENVVGTFGILYGGFEEVAENGWEVWANLQAAYTPVAGYSFLVFNLLCAPCFAAMGAIKREMNNTKWFLTAIGYQTLLGYCTALVVYQIGTLITTGAFGIGTVAAFVLIVIFFYLLFRRYNESTTFEVNIPAKI